MPRRNPAAAGRHVAVMVSQRARGPPDTRGPVVALAATARERARVVVICPHLISPSRARKLRASNDITVIFRPLWTGLQDRMEVDLHQFERPRGTAPERSACRKSSDLGANLDVAPIPAGDRPTHSSHSFRSSRSLRRW